MKWRRMRSDGHQWMKSYDDLATLQLLLKTQVSISLRVTRVSIMVSYVQPHNRQQIRRLSARWRRSRGVITGFNPVKQPCWIKLVVVLFNLSSYVEAQVSPLIPAWFITLGMLYEDFLMDSLRVSPAGHHCWLRTNLLFACRHLIHMYLSGEKFVVMSSICLIEWKYFDLLLEEHFVWLWLCGRGLIVDTGCYYRNELLCGDLGIVFSHMHVFFSWYRLWHWSLFESSCQNFSMLPLLAEGDGLVEHLFWQI